MNIVVNKTIPNSLIKNEHCILCGYFPLVIERSAGFSERLKCSRCEMSLEMDTTLQYFRIASLPQSLQSDFNSDWMKIHDLKTYIRELYNSQLGRVHTPSVARHITGKLQLTMEALNPPDAQIISNKETSLPHSTQPVVLPERQEAPQLNEFELIRAKLEGAESIASQEKVEGAFEVPTTITGEQWAETRVDTIEPFKRLSHMNVMITGDVSTLAEELALKMQRNKIKVVITKEKSTLPQFKNIAFHPITTDTESFNEVMSAYRFDAVIFLASREEQLLDNKAGGAGKMLDVLVNVLRMCQSSNVRRLFYISSTEVYGKGEAYEDQIPNPISPNGYILKAGEQECQYYSETYGVKTSIIRIPYVYGINEHNSLVSKTIKACISKEEVVLPGGEDVPCAFLHAEDLVNFIMAQLNEMPNLELGIYNLAPTRTYTLGQFGKCLAVYFPKAFFFFEENSVHATCPVQVNQATSYYHWKAERNLDDDLAELVDILRKEPKPRSTLVKRIPFKWRDFIDLIKWAELILGGVATQFLVNFTGTPILFRYIDFRLLFVVIMGITHGTTFGLLASILTSLSMAFALYQNGVDWAVFVNSVQFWLPFAFYLAAGVITGYLHDKNENMIKFLDENNKLIHEKYTFLYNVYTEIRQLKDQFHDQLIGYRDSFGRIFNITQKLDSLQEEEILFNALNTIEIIMENDKIAIYSIDTKGGYARLELSSRGLNEKITKTLNLSVYPEILEKLKQGEVYQNINLRPHYPSFFAPIKNGEHVIAAVAIWEAKFEQQTLYHFNLFKVMCGLIQSAIVRATLFENANAEKIYIPSTRILHQEAFKEVLRAKSEMKTNKNADFQLVRIDGVAKTDSFDWVNFYELLSNKIRTVDVIGLLEDNNCYVVLSQADEKNIEGILNRMKKSGVRCELVNERMISYV